MGRKARSGDLYTRLTAPMDLRCGMDRLLVYVREALGRDPGDGGAYVFRNRSSSRIELLCCDAQGTWLAVRRLQQGHFVWPHEGASVWTVNAEAYRST